MALTASAAIVVTPDGNWNPDPVANHAGWNNTSGDKTWVPDEAYSRRVLLSLTGNAGEYINIVNWEIYGGDSVPFVDDASVNAILVPDPPLPEDPPTDPDDPDSYTNDPAPGASLVNDRTTRTIWSRISATPGEGNPYFEDTGTPWVPLLRANGPRTIIEFPSYMKWTPDVGPEEEIYEVEAFLPGAGGVASATTSITLTKPDIALLGGNTGSPQPR